MYLKSDNTRTTFKLMLCVNHPTPSHYCTQHSEYSRTPKMAFLGVMIAPLTYKDIYIFSSFQNETSNLPVNLERKKSFCSIRSLCISMDTRCWYITIHSVPNNRKFLMHLLHAQKTKKFFSWVFYFLNKNTTK